MRVRRLRQPARSRVLVEELPRRVLRLLHVRFVERIDPEDRARDGRRDFPADEFCTERRRFRPVDLDHRRASDLDCAVIRSHVHEEAIVAVRRRVSERLAGNRYDTHAVLTGALRDQLFDPEPERFELWRQHERQLVAANPRARANCETERDRRIRGRLSRRRRRCFEHRQPPPHERRDVDAHQRRRDETEERQRRVPAADI